MTTIKKPSNLQECRLILVNPSDTSIRGEYRSKQKNKSVYLTTDFQIKEGKLEQGEYMWRKDLTKKEPEFRFMWDKNDESHQGSILRKFLLSHMLVFTEGWQNPNLTQKMFELIDMQTVNEEKYVRVLMINDAINLFKKLDWRQQRDACYAFGGNPSQLTKRELFLDMLDPDTGRLMFYDKTGEVIIDKAADFIEKFGNKDKREQAETEAYCRKAISLDIIRESVTETGSIYTLDGETIASNILGVFSYMRNFPEKYLNQIKKPVDLRDSYAEPDDMDERPITLSEKETYDNFVKASSDKTGGSQDDTGKGSQQEKPKKPTWTIQAYEKMLEGLKKVMDSNKSEAEKKVQSDAIMSKVEECEAALTLANVDIAEVKAKYAALFAPATA